ncbi:MAG: hypothetical protein WCA21_05250 [Terracidiphilus sp.]
MAAASGQHVFNAPLTCPCYPGNAVPVTASIDALADAPSRQPIPLSHPLLFTASSGAVRPAPLCNRAGRSPPSFIPLG